MKRLIFRISITNNVEMVLLSDSQVLKAFSYPAGWNRKLDYYHFFIQLETSIRCWKRTILARDMPASTSGRMTKSAPIFSRISLVTSFFDLGNDVLDT